MKLGSIVFTIAVATAFPIGAQPLDCNALKATAVPFAIDYRFERANPDGSPSVPASGQRSQILRGPGETLAYTVPSPGQFVRTRSRYELFPIDLYFGATGEVRRWSYSIDTSIDPLISACWAMPVPPRLATCSVARPSCFSMMSAAM